MYWAIVNNVLYASIGGFVSCIDTHLAMIKFCIIYIR